jgi:hypothetical protein
MANNLKFKRDKELEQVVLEQLDLLEMQLKNDAQVDTQAQNQLASDLENVAEVKKLMEACEYQNAHDKLLSDFSALKKRPMYSMLMVVFRALNPYAMVGDED